MALAKRSIVDFGVGVSPRYEIGPLTFRPRTGPNGSFH